MADNNYIRSVYKLYESTSDKIDRLYMNIEYSEILDIHPVEPLAPKKIDFVNFGVIFLDGKGDKCFICVGEANTYVCHNGIKYEGECGMEKLIMILKKKSIEKLLEDM